MRKNKSKYKKLSMREVRRINPCGTSKICLPSDLNEINRRQLLIGGACLTAYLPLSKFIFPSLYAQESYPIKKKLVWINMRGGWDILEVTDPKVSSTSGIDMIYDWGLANQVSGSAGTKIGRWLPNIAAIGEDLLVVRGVAMGTTSHNAGSVYMDTGVLSNSGNVNAASIPAIVASQGASTIPIIQLNGGSDPQTDRGLLNPVSVVRANNLSLYRSMFPEDSSEIDKKLSVMNYVKDSIEQLKGEIGSTDRLTEIASAEEKVRTQFSQNVGQKLSLTDAELSTFVEGAPENFNTGMAQSFALALKLIKEDIVDVVNLGVGGFDTHSNQSISLERTLTSVDFAIGSFVSGLKAAGKLDSTLIVLYSDFGRTPKINNSNGRDHWPVGGALMIGGSISGGRSVGATDDDLRALYVHKDTGVTIDENDPNAVQLSPAHIGGSVLELTLGSDYMKYRDSYLYNIPALTKLKKS
ncbi:MAG: DUF1501 domain-containing protein [Bdellovibrionota bacterium]